jgi:hypothetical protein
LFDYRRLWRGVEESRLRSLSQQGQCAAIRLSNPEADAADFTAMSQNEQIHSRELQYGGWEACRYMATNAAGRIDDIDFWRGFALLTIFIDHAPDNIFQHLTHGNFAF